jgi:hypothetical protein
MNKPLPSSRYVIIGQPGEEHFDPWSYSLMHRAAPATEIAMSRYTGDIAECAPPSGRLATSNLDLNHFGAHSNHPIHPIPIKRAPINLESKEHQTE